MGRFINPFSDIGFKRLAEITDLASLSKDERMIDACRRMMDIC